MTQPVLLEKRADGVAMLRLNRPEKLNAFNQAMIDCWYAQLSDALADPAVQVVVVTGNGRGFCAGGDIDDTGVSGQRDSITRKNLLWEHIQKIPMAIEASDKPVIAAVNGVARGAGCDMALMCDMRIAAASASFGESYINLGVIAGDAGTWYLPRIIGAARALELFWTGRVVDADEALRIGLVNRVVPDDQLAAVTDEIATKIAAQPPLAVKMFKRAVYQGLTMPLATHLDMVSSHMAVLQDTQDWYQRVAAFNARARSKGK